MSVIEPNDPTSDYIIDYTKQLWNYYFTKQCMNVCSACTIVYFINSLGVYDYFKHRAAKFVSFWRARYLRMSLIFGSVLFLHYSFNDIPTVWMDKFINIYELNGDAMFWVCLEEYPNKVNLEKYNQMIE